jgi:hypothetical protein
MAVLYNVDSVKPKGSTKIFVIQTTDHFNSSVSIKLPFSTQIEKLSRDVEDKKQAVTALQLMKDTETKKLQLMKDTETKKLEEKIATLNSDRNDVSQRLDQEKSTCSRNINNLQHENYDFRTRETNCNVMNSGLVKEKPVCNEWDNTLLFRLKILKMYCPGNDTPNTDDSFQTRIYLFERPSIVVVCQFLGRKFQLEIFSKQ